MSIRAACTGRLGGAPAGSPPTQPIPTSSGSSDHPAGGILRQMISLGAKLAQHAAIQADAPAVTSGADT